MKFQFPKSSKAKSIQQDLHGFQGLKAPSTPQANRWTYPTHESSSVTSRMKRAAHTETPVDPQVDRDDQVLVGEDVHLARPPAHRCMPALDQLGVEESVEGVGLAETIHLPSLHQHVHVEVDDLGKQHRPTCHHHVHAEVDHLGKQHRPT